MPLNYIRFFRWIGPSLLYVDHHVTANAGLGRRAFNMHFVVLFLHGLGDRSKSWLSFPNQINLPSSYEIEWKFLDAPLLPVSVNNGRKMPAWFDCESIPITDESPDDVQGLLEAVNIVSGFIKTYEDKGIPASQIFVGGFSQGAAVSSLVVQRYPKKLAGGIMLSGWLPMRENFECKHNHVPIFQGHGDADDKVDFDLAQISSEVLSNSGSFDVTFKTYSGMTHSINGHEIRELRAWFIQTLNSLQSTQHSLNSDEL